MPLSMIDSQLVSHWHGSPNFNDRVGGRNPDMLIIHYTGMPDHDRARFWLATPESKVSCHYLVDIDGTITQMVAERYRAWHAGLSHWAGETDLNSCSIGIEIHHPGHAGGNPDFPDAQMAGVTLLALDICARRNIPAKRVLGHSDVAPARKSDPGENFDWARLYRAGVGLWIPPLKTDGADAANGANGADALNTGLGAGDVGDHVAALQRQLSAFGYGVPCSGTYCEATGQVITAFQRHWRQSRVDGRADRSTLETLTRLSKLTAGDVPARI